MSREDELQWALQRSTSQPGVVEDPEHQRGKKR